MHLTREQAWKKIQQSYQDHYLGSGTGESLSRCGLCFAVEILFSSGAIISETRRQMLAEDIKSVKPPGAVMWYWPQDRSGARSRIKAINKILKGLKQNARKRIN